MSLFEIGLLIAIVVVAVIGFIYNKTQSERIDEGFKKEMDRQKQRKNKDLN
jgi:hypothetical protein